MLSALADRLPAFGCWRCRPPRISASTQSHSDPHREEMAKDGYLWWRRRLGHLAQYFHAYRIDHILGFFRIWEVGVLDRVSGVLS